MIKRMSDRAMPENLFNDFTILKDTLCDCKKIIIAGHINPDGDAVGACFAFALCMKEIGKQPVILLDNYSCKYSFLKGSEFIYDGDYSELSGDAFVALDTSSVDRFSSEAFKVYERTAIKIVIDHHISNVCFADYNFVVADASSTSEIMYDAVTEFIKPTKDIAECIYTGIIFDTGGFRHGSTTPKTQRIAAELIALGIDFSHIYTEIMQIHSFEEAKIFGIALDRLVLDESYPIAYSFLTIEDMKRANATYNDLDGVVEYLLNIRGVQASFLITERPENITKASIRSKQIDVSKVAGMFGGGGHKKAAGATLLGTVDQACETMLNALKAALKN